MVHVSAEASSRNFTNYWWTDVISPRINWQFCLPMQLLIRSCIHGDLLDQELSSHINCQKDCEKMWLKNLDFVVSEINIFKLQLWTCCGLFHTCREFLTQNETRKSLPRWKVRIVHQVGPSNEGKLMMLMLRRNGRRNQLQSKWRVSQ